MCNVRGIYLCFFIPELEALESWLPLQLCTPRGPLDSRLHTYFMSEISACSLWTTKAWEKPWWKLFSLSRVFLPARILASPHQAALVALHDFEERLFYVIFAAVFSEHVHLIKASSYLQGSASPQLFSSCSPLNSSHVLCAASFPGLSNRKFSSHLSLFCILLHFDLFHCFLHLCPHSYHLHQK